MPRRHRDDDDNNNVGRDTDEDMISRSDNRMTKIDIPYLVRFKW